MMERFGYAVRTSRACGCEEIHQVIQSTFIASLSRRRIEEIHLKLSSNAGILIGWLLTMDHVSPSGDSGSMEKL